MASGSSAKKVARLAQKGKGKKVRFQGGTVFPSVMAVVIVIGLGLVTYARQSAPSKNTPPTINDHWHISYGFYHCDSFLGNLTGTKEDGSSAAYAKYNIHSHDDGVIHWHPSALATGTRAKLGLFFETYGVTVNTKGITFSKDQNKGVSYKVGTDKCKDKSGKLVDAQVQAIVWPNYDDQTKSKRYITDFDNIRVTKDQMAITIAYVAPGTEVPMPETASNLPELGAKDSATQATTTTVKGATTTTVKGATTTTVAATTTTGG